MIFCEFKTGHDLIQQNPLFYNKNDVIKNISTQLLTKNCKKPRNFQFLFMNNRCYMDLSIVQCFFEVVQMMFTFGIFTSNNVV